MDASSTSSNLTTLVALGMSVTATLIALFAAIVSYVLYRSQSDPEVIVHAQADEKRQTIINLIIENIGKGSAYDVSFDFSYIPSKAFGMEVAGAKKAENTTKGPLVNGIPFLPPGAKRILTWGQYGGLAKSLGDETFSVVIEYYGRHFGVRRLIKHTTTCPLEILSFEATDASNKNYPKQIAENVAKLTEAAQKAVEIMSKQG